MFEPDIPNHPYAFLTNDLWITRPMIGSRFPIRRVYHSLVPRPSNIGGWELEHVGFWLGPGGELMGYPDVRFRENPDGSFTMTRGKGMRLERLSPELLELTTAAGFHIFLDRQYRSIYVKDPGGIIVEQSQYDEPDTWGSRGLTRIVFGGHVEVKLEYDAQKRVSRILHGDRWVAYTYADDGSLAEVRDPIGLRARYTYHADTRLKTVTDGRGVQVISLEYLPDGRLRKKSMAEGLFVDYSYDDAAGRVTYTTNTGKQYTYTVSGKTITLTKPGDRTYEKAAHPVTGANTSTDPLGNVTTTWLDDRGNEIRKRNPLGAETRVEYQSTTNQPIRKTDAMGNVEQAEVDALGRITRVLNGEQEGWTYTRDEVGRPSTATDPEGNVWTYLYSDREFTGLVDPEGNTTSLQYDANGFLYRLIDGKGNVTTRVNDARGRVTQVIAADGSSRTYEYDLGDLLIRETDAAGRVTQREYDGRGRLVKTTLPDGTVKTTTYDADGRIVAKSDGGKVTSFGHDDAGNVIQEIDPDGLVTERTFDKNGNVLTERTPTGSLITRTYDAANRLTKKETDGEDVIEREYDLADRLIRRTTTNGSLSNTFDRAGRLIKQADAQGRLTTLGYDGRGKLTGIQGEAGRQLAIAYNRLGDPVASVDALGAGTQSLFDAAGHLQASYDAAGQPTYFQLDSLGRPIAKADARGQAVNTRYDAAGNPVSITDARGNTTLFEYDAGNRITRVVYPDGTSRTQTFDGEGRLLSVLDGRGNRQTVTYQEEGKVVHIDYSDGSSVEASYDLNGHVNSVTDATGTSYFNFDGAGRLLWKMDPQGRTCEWRYDDRGKKSQLTRPDGSTVLWSYDSEGDPISISDSLTGAYTNRFVNGQLVERTFPNGCRMLVEHDLAGRVVGLRHLDKAGSDLTKNFRYTLDANGNRTSVKDGTSPHWDYAFDAVHQLVSATNSAGQKTSYEIDAAGNITRVTDHAGASVASTFNALNQLVTQGTTEVVHDGCGNLVQKTQPGQVTRCEYSAADQLVRIVHPDLTETRFERNGLGVVVAITSPSGARTELFWVEGRLMAEYGAGFTRFYLDDLGYVENGAPYCLHIDGQGSIMAISDAAGIQTDEYSYDPWGVPTHVSGSSSQPLGYTGQYWLANPGLLLFRYRPYDPALKRFVQRDPSRITENWAPNLYTYADNNPVSNIDFLGLYAVQTDGSLLFVDSKEFLAWAERVKQDRMWFISYPTSEGVVVSHLYGFDGTELELLAPHGAISVDMGAPRGRVGGEVPKPWIDFTTGPHENHFTGIDYTPGFDSGAPEAVDPCTAFGDPDLCDLPGQDGDASDSPGGDGDAGGGGGGSRAASFTNDLRDAMSQLIAIRNAGKHPLAFKTAAAAINWMYNEALQHANRLKHRLQNDDTAKNNAGTLLGRAKEYVDGTIAALTSPYLLLGYTDLYEDIYPTAGFVAVAAVPNPGWPYQWTSATISSGTLYHSKTGDIAATKNGIFDVATKVTLTGFDLITLLPYLLVHEAIHLYFHQYYHMTYDEEHREIRWLLRQVFGWSAEQVGI